MLLLKKQGIEAEVINIHTIKPLDTALIQKSLEKTGCGLIAEEHMINGGLGDSIAQWVVQNHPLPLGFVGVNDCFGESGKPQELMEKYGLSKENILQKGLELIKRKNN